MPPGRPRLNPELKQQHVEDARKRYEEKKTASSRALANATSPSKREDIAASDFLTRRKYAVKAAAASEMYRARKQQEQRAQRRVAEGVKKEARRREREELCKKHQPPVTRPSSKAPTKPSRTHPQPRPRMRLAVRPPVCLQRRRTMMSQTKTLTTKGPPFIAKHRPGQTVPRIPRDVPIAMRRIVLDARACARAPAIGFGTMVVIFFLLGFSRSQARAISPRLCMGDVNLGQLRSHVTLQCTEYHHHKEASTPQGFVPLSPESTPPSSPSDLTASTPPRTPSPAAASASIKKPNQERADNIARTLPEGVGRGVVPHLASPRPLPVPMTPRRAEPKAAGPPNARLLREELDFLAATRPPPVPISPERLRQQFVRVLGAEAARPPAAKASGASSPKKTRAPEATGVKARRDPYCPPPDNALYPLRAPTVVVDAGESAGDPLMYAVSGQNRIFHDRNRALAAFKSKPGADLIFSRDEDEVFGFLAEGVDSKEVEGKVNVK
ncbi:hypothetical protein B0H13DRAFT_1897948 [Mycena leptocephala]|nr:hypothetical protein B0H13DRAFT_1897948 [Mycena leptocephala]